MRRNKFLVLIIGAALIIGGLWSGRGFTNLPGMLTERADNPDHLTIRPLMLERGKKYGHILEPGESSMWLESPTKYDIVSQDYEFDLIDMKGRITTSFEKEKWPIGEPFQIIAIATRQKITITVE